MLIKRPDVNHRLRLELSSLGKSYSSTDLANLPYLDAVIRETLRVYPPAPAPMPRVVPKTGFEFEGVSYPPDVSKILERCLMDLRAFKPRQGPVAANIPPTDRYLSSALHHTSLRGSV